ncbi:hypothetical protein HanPI659440_Chr12g0461781 [Helianthus annuus]|nr:hypothetical protein HanPI659440_Chr12g0461781 [Helianthus annuus]
MGESLGVSVSFGKYENDALSWEKWSTFSPNKYLEEVGKCSTPGSVAQKKAFFEAHYKKIAAMKAEAEAELLDQQQDSTSDDQQIKDQHKDCTQTELCVSDEPLTDGSGEFQEDKPLTDQVDAEPIPSEAPTTLNSNADKLEEAVLVNVESMKLVKQHFQVDLDTREDPPQIRQPKPQNVTRKVTPNKVEKNPIGMKKKPASLIPKSPETPASTLSKPKPKPKPKPTSAPTLKKASAPSSSAVSSSKNKYQSLSESRRVTPVSLHMSMSMSSVNSDTASSVTSSRRRSLFMEQMGDKDIVKRAFKTFQNRVNQLPSSASGPKQVPAKRSEQKTRTSVAYQKENERSRKTPVPAAEKINPVRGQLGPTWKSVSSGSLKGVGVDERRLKAGPTTVALKSDERAEKRKEFLKKLEEKSNARRSEASLKPKEVKDAEMKKAKQKAKAMPGVLKSG